MLYPFLMLYIMLNMLITILLFCDFLDYAEKGPGNRPPIVKAFTSLLILFQP